MRLPYNVYCSSVILRKIKSIASSVNHPKRNIPKTELPKTILIAVPNSVEFHNYESNKLYRVDRYCKT